MSQQHKQHHVLIGTIVDPDVDKSGADAVGHSSHGHGHAAGSRDKGWDLVLLSFSALGIIYGDIGTSPLYAYQAVFTAAPQQAEVLAAASLFFWTLTLIVLVKYVGIIIRFDDNGEGGTFALYSLMCRAAGFTPYGPAQPEELQLAGLSGGLWDVLPSSVARGRWWSVSNRKGNWIKRAYMRSRTLQVALLVVVMIATAMVVGDGVLTPSISVLSAVSGLKVAAPSMAQNEVVGVAIIVLVVLFGVQFFGTAKISAVFSPTICVWLLFNAGIGLANLGMFGWGAWQAISPHHAIQAFRGPGGFEAGWRMLAGVMLAITGAEAMYADLGHFSAKAVTLSFCGLVYPCLVVTYMGQATYLLSHPEAYTDPFWKSVPSGAFWPMLIVATAASVVASQALISGVFSIMRQAMNLGVFPPMRITHTDSMSEGQIYIRSINFMLMLGCVAMVAGFQDTTALGHAYGVAVMSVMFITSILAGIVMLVCYSINPLLVALFLLFFVPLEGLFLSSNIIKIPEGGWVTIMIAAIVASINLIFWYGTSAKGKWYKAQAARNRGLLAQLPLPQADSDADLQDTQPLIPAAAVAAGTAASTHRRHPGGSAASDAAQWAAEAATRDGSSGSILPELPAAAGTSHRGRLGSVSAPGARADAAASAPAGELLGAAGAGEIPAAAKAQGPLVSRSWTTGRVSGFGKTAGSAGGMMFHGEPLTRLRGLGIIYTQATSGLPAVLQHLLVNMPVLHEVTVLLTVRVITRPYATQEERFLVRRSKSLSGFFRVIARYGYMESVDHGPQFVKQLMSCLVRYAAQQPSDLGPLSKAPHASHAPAAAVVGMDRVSHGDAVAIELQPVAEGTAAGAGADRPLARWSRVPVSPADAQVLQDAARAGPDLAVRSFMAGSRLSPRGSLELLPSIRSSRSELGPMVLGRESINRQQYSLQRASSRRFGRTATGLTQSPAISSSPAGSGALVGTGSAAAAGLDAAAPADGVGPAVGGKDAASGTPFAAAAAAAAAAARASTTQPAAAAASSTSGFSPAQLSELEALLRCFRQERVVYIMGRSQLVAAMSNQQAGARCCSLASAGLYCKGVVLGAYRVLANNTHPSSQSWRLPDDQLMTVSMVVRI